MHDQSEPDIMPEKECNWWDSGCAMVWTVILGVWGSILLKTFVEYIKSR